MASAELLRKTVAEFYGVDEDRVGPAFSFEGRGQTSIARAALDALIRRRVGLTSRSVYSAKTYAELEAELAPGPAGGPPVPNPASPAPATAPATATAGAVRCGVDMELVANLPRTDDPWEEPFYRATFTPAEIAYCLLQEAPALHFAARWCAKEALKKCDGALTGEAMDRLEVVSEPSGAPYLVHHAGGAVRRLPHAVSLSHTPEAAVAVVVVTSGGDPPAGPVAPAAGAAGATAAAAGPVAPRRSVAPATALGVVALAVAALALIRTFLGGV